MLICLLRLLVISYILSIQKLDEFLCENESDIKYQVELIQDCLHIATVITTRENTQKFNSYVSIPR